MTILRTNTISGIGSNGVVFDGSFGFTSQNYVILPKGTSAQEGVLRTTVDVVGAGSTYYDNLVLAMPFNAATGFADVSSRNRNPGVYGNTTISTAQSKYYGSSAYFDGTGDYLAISSSSDFAFGTGNFTIETWWFPTSTTRQAIYHGSWGADYSIGIDYNGASSNLKLGMWASSNGSSWNLLNADSGGNGITAGTPVQNQWNHIAFVRNGSTFSMYLNGVSVGIVTGITAAVDVTASDAQVIGEWWYPGAMNSISGYLQDLRVYKGLAKYTGNFTPPDRIAELGVGFKAGALRYNTDSNKVELYDGNQWAEVQSSSPNLNGGARGVFGCSNAASGNVNTIDFITISSTGNASDFGDLTQARYISGACSSSTRGVFGGGVAPGVLNTIDFITISSTGNAVDFGDLTQERLGPAACSSSTRGVFGGGATPTFVNTIDFITISSTGNAADFGDLFQARNAPAACSSSTRGVFGGGQAPGAVNTIDFIAISSTGNATDFGDLTQARFYLSACSSSTRGVFGGGYLPGNVNTIDFIIISSTGNATDFGDLTQVRHGLGACSSSTRGVFGGGYAPGNVNIIDFITISSTGNASDFGDLFQARHGLSACSNGHGGL
jgi:Concanavalin A-like lectin/glucanases superfamily